MDEGGRAQRGDEGHHALGAAAPLQHLAEGRRSSSSTSARTSQPLLDGHAKAMVVRGEPAGGRALAARDRQIHQGSRLQDRHAGRLLRRGRTIGVRPGPVHGDQQDAEPEPARPRHPRSLRTTRRSIRFCLSPTSSRPASISRCSAACMSTSGWRASRRCRRSRG